MKRILLGAIIAIIVVLVLAVLGVSLFLDDAVKRGIETFGPRFTGVDVSVESVKLSLFSGSGAIKHLVVGNPKGYSTPQAFQVGNASVAIQPRSLLADKIIVKSIHIEGPEITLEGTLSENNLEIIKANVDSASGGLSSQASTTNTPVSKPARKLQVDQFDLTGARLNVVVHGIEQSWTGTMPDIHLANLGTGPDGITQKELTAIVVSEVVKSAREIGKEKLAELARNALAKKLGNSAPDATQQLGKTVGNLFRKK